MFGKDHVSLLLMAVTVPDGRRNRGGLSKTGRKEGSGGGGDRDLLSLKNGKTTEGRAMAAKERRGGGGVKECTRLSASGVPCGPGSSVREGVKRKNGEGG